MSDISAAPAADSPAPKPSRLRKRGVRFLKTLGVLIALLALVHAEEYWRGNRAYDRARADWKAAGLADYTELFKDSPAITPERNLFEAPFFNEWKAGTMDSFMNPLPRRLEKWYDASNTKLFPQKTDWFRANWSAVMGTPSSEPEVGASKPVQLPTVIDLKNSPTRKPGTGLSIAPIAGQSDAKTLIDALETDFPEFKTLVETERSRPESALGFRYTAGVKRFVELPTPSFRVVRAAAFPLMLHALAKLDEGDGSSALAAVRASLRYEAAASECPTLVNGMINLVHAKILPVRVTYAALEKGAWSDAQLQEVEKAFAAISPLQSINRAIQGEAQGGSATIAALPEIPGDTLLSQYGILRVLIPNGWAKLNAAHHLDARRKILIHDGAAQGRTDIKAIKAARDEENESLTTPWNFVSKLSLPALLKVEVNAAQTQTKLNCCRLGIALERHRLKTGAFPDSLDALAPGLIEKIPVGPVGGLAPAYSKNTDGGYTLTYKGEDFADADLSSDNPVGKDIVWTMPAPKAR